MKIKCLYKQNQTSAIFKKKPKATSTHTPEQELSSDKKKTDLICFCDLSVHKRHSKITERILHTDG